MPVSDGRFLGLFFVLFSLDFMNFKSELLSGSSYSAVLPQRFIVLWTVAANWGSITVRLPVLWTIAANWEPHSDGAPMLWTHQIKLVPVPTIACWKWGWNSVLSSHPTGCFAELSWVPGGSLCDSSLAPDLRAPKLNLSPLPLGSLSVPWLVKNKDFTMASCCICFNTMRCFLLTWTLVSRRDKQMAFR